MKDAIDERPVVAAFDFDGTLTYHDTLFFFLLYAVGPLKTFLYCLSLVPTFIAYVLGKKTRQQTKERVLQQFFKGMPIEELRKIGAAFAAERIASCLRPEGMKRLQWHKKQGHRCVLVSASLDVYLEPWAKSVGFHDALTSCVAFDTEGRVTGKLEGPNCRRKEKVRRLTELLGSLEGYRLYAYGDSQGDKELLEVANHSYYRKMPEEDENEYN